MSASLAIDAGLNPEQRAKANQKRYMDDLAAQIRVDIMYKNAMSKQGSFKPIPIPQFKTSQEILGDTTEQRKIALEHLKPYFSDPNEAASVVNQLSTTVPPGGISDVAAFNRYWNRLSKELVPGTLTPDYVLRLWDRLAAVITFEEEKAGPLIRKFATPGDRANFMRVLTDQARVLEGVVNEKFNDGLIDAMEKKDYEDKIALAVTEESKAKLDSLWTELHGGPVPMGPMGGPGATPPAYLRDLLTDVSRELRLSTPAKTPNDIVYHLDINPNLKLNATQRSNLEKIIDNFDVHVGSAPIQYLELLKRLNVFIAGDTYTRILDRIAFEFKTGDDFHNVADVLKFIGKSPAADRPGYLSQLGPIATSIYGIIGSPLFSAITKHNRANVLTWSLKQISDITIGKTDAEISDGIRYR